jgi:RNA polymerase sigma factor (sigma-70 family)
MLRLVDQNAHAKPAPRDAEAYARFRAELDDQFRAPLMAYFGKRVASRGEAEDLTQEVFVRLLAQADVPVAARARPYIFTVAANLLRDRARRAASRQASAHVSLAHVLLDRENRHGLVEDREPERVLMGKESLEKAIAALSELGETTRNAFVLFRLEKMRQRDIAALFGLSVSTIEKHIMKAMAHLGAKLAATSDTDQP